MFCVDFNVDNFRLFIEPDSIRFRYTIEVAGNMLTIVTSFYQEIYGFGDENLILFFDGTQTILDHGSYNGSSYALKSYFDLDSDEGNRCSLTLYSCGGKLHRGGCIERCGLNGRNRRRPVNYSVCKEG